MSQKEKILQLLEEKEWVCTNEFYASYIADPRKRICELKDKGFVLEWRWCKTHNHGKSKEWRLATTPVLPPELDHRNEFNGPNAKYYVLPTKGAFQTQLL